VKRPSTRHLSAAALLPFIPLALLPISAQKKEPSAPQKISAIRVSVNSALVPVVVRDAQGHPIGDLTKGDFQVFDRGNPISVSGFAVEKRAEIYAIKSAEPPPAAPILLTLRLRRLSSLQSGSLFFFSTISISTTANLCAFKRRPTSYSLKR
jgi:hypothetical protein